MTKESLFTAVGWVLFVVIGGSLIISGAVFLRRDVQRTQENNCIALGERLGYETELIGGYCYIEVRPGLKVREDQVLDFLPVIDCR